MRLRRHTLQVVAHLQHGPEHETAERSKPVGLGFLSEHRIACGIDLALGERAERDDGVHVILLRGADAIAMAEIQP